MQFLTKLFGNFLGSRSVHCANLKIFITDKLPVLNHASIAGQQITNIQLQENYFKRKLEVGITIGVNFKYYGLGMKFL